jgi:hypothetical protein
MVFIHKSPKDVSMVNHSGSRDHSSIRLFFQIFFWFPGGHHIKTGGSTLMFSRPGKKDQFSACPGTAAGTSIQDK